MGLIIPEVVYREYARQPEPRARWHQTINSTGAASVGLSISFSIPLDFDYYLMTMHATATAGAAQTVSNCYLNFQRDLNSSNTIILHLRQTTPAPIKEIINEVWSGVILPAGSTLTFVGNFSAAGAANQVSIQTMGLLLPRLDLLG